MDKKVRCPNCNIRLFDLKSEQIELTIKCPRCKELLVITKPQDKNDIIHISSYRATETEQAT